VDQDERALSDAGIDGAFFGRHAEGGVERGVSFATAGPGTTFCDYPAGKSVAASTIGESSPPCKNISVFPKCKSVYMICHPVLLRGALAIVTNVGRVAVDATASGAQERLQGEMNLVSDTRRVNDPRRSVRQNRVVLASVADAKSAEVF
jgi:hypothetical protein